MDPNSRPLELSECMNTISGSNKSFVPSIAVIVFPGHYLRIFAYFGAPLRSTAQIRRGFNRSQDSMFYALMTLLTCSNNKRASYDLVRGNCQEYGVGLQDQGYQGKRSNRSYRDESTKCFDR